MRRTARCRAEEVSICFLAPQFGGKQDRIELACTALAKQVGETSVKRLQTALRAAAGDQVRGTTMVGVIQPGTLGAAQQAVLTKALTSLL